MRKAEMERPCAGAGRTASRRSGRAGFTLLEVLAAVAILALWYTALAGAGISSLRAEGESRRRLEAGLLADQSLANVLATTVEGDKPEVGEDLVQNGPYRIVTRVGGMNVEGIGLDEPEFEPPPTTGIPTLPGAEGEPPADLVTLVQGEIAGMSNNIYSIRVVVAWQEGHAERRVVRTTFAFDRVSAKNMYDGSNAPGEGALANEGDALGEEQ